MHRKIFLIILLTLVAANGCSGKESTPKSKESTENISQKGSTGIKQEVYSFKVEGFNRERRVQWGLEGESANIAFEKININNLKAIYYGDGMTFTVLADKAVYDKKTQDIELTANVVGKTSDGGELITDYAMWQAKSEEIVTESNVVVKRRNIVCKGKGLVTKPRLKWVTFKKDVEVDIAPDTKILCSGPFELNQEECVAIFNENVRVLDKTSDTFTDKLTVYLDPKTNEIIRIITEGHVRVESRGDIDDLAKMSF